MQMQMRDAAEPGRWREKIAGVVGNVAELDCDIIIDEAPDNLTPQLEQFQALVELKKMDANGEIPFRAIVEAIPNLKNRAKFLEHMDQAAQQPARAPPPELIKMQIDGAGEAAGRRARRAAGAAARLPADSELDSAQEAACRDRMLQRAEGTLPKSNCASVTQRRQTSARWRSQRDD